MPLYRYAPVKPPCRLCGAGFEIQQPAAAAALADCPTCGQPVQRSLIHAVNTPKVLKPLSISGAKSAGFTVLKRTSSGEFEKQ